jgi:integrase
MMATISRRRNRWVIDFYDTQGKRRWITMPKGSPKKKAKEKLREIEDQVKRGVYIPKSKMPLFKSVAETWLEIKKPDVRPATWEGYEGHIKNHFDEFKGIPIDRITTASVEKFISARRVEGMNLSTLRKLIVTLNQIFKYAVRHQYITDNPVTNAARPKKQKRDHKQEIKPLNPDQINALLGSVDDLKYNTLIRLAVFSGARQGELLGLKWSDVLWNENQIEIQRSFNHGRMQLPKTETSRRRIDLGPAMMKALKRWRLMSRFSDDSDLVFPSEVGNPMCQSNLLNRHFFPALTAAELPKIRFHDLRHTYASLKIEQGENIVYISRQMGHSSPVVTSTIYAHLINDTNYESACGLEEMIFEKNGCKVVAATKKGPAEKSASP